MLLASQQNRSYDRERKEEAGDGWMRIEKEWKFEVTKAEHRRSQEGKERRRESSEKPEQKAKRTLGFWSFWKQNIKHSENGL